MSDIIEAVKTGIESLEAKTGNRLREFDERLTGLNNSFTRMAQQGVKHPDAFTAGGSARLGDLVVKQFEENRSLFEKTRSVRLSVKTASDAITTTNGRTILGVGVGAIAGGVLGLQNALPNRVALGLSTAEYSRYTGQQGAAAVQAAEGDLKASVRPDHALISQSAITVAGFSKISRQALNDSRELVNAVETTLNRSVATALDAALVNGVVSPTFSGFESLASASSSLLYTALPDAVSEGVANMQADGFSPDLVALNPADWLAVTVAKGVDGHYLSGAYLGALPTEMRGLRVVLSPSVDAGKALLLDSSHSELLVVDGFTVEMAYAGDDFVRNLVSLLGEIRVIPIFRTLGSARLITPKAA